MTSMRLLLLALVLSVSTASAHPSRPTFVLVHGALFTSGGWGPLQNLLQNGGFNVVTVDLPGRLNDGIDAKEINLERAARKVEQVVKLQNGPVILVGHSQGGAVITQAQTYCPDKVQALVYVAAVVPKDGEIAFASLDPNRDTGFSKCATPDAPAALFRLNTQGPLARLFFADAAPDVQEATVGTMVSEPMGIGTTPAHLNTAAFDAVNKYYIEATADRIVTIETQRIIQARVKWTKTYSMSTSHCPFLSAPGALAGHLLEIGQSNSPVQK